METRPPVIGSWYQVIGGDSFEVVAYDSDDGTVEIQYFDGSVEELDMEAWEETVMRPIPAPEDWSGSLDIGDKEDYGVDLESNGEADLNSILDSFD